MNYGTIYKITNIVTGQYYIGKTIYDIALRFRQHCNDAHNRHDNSILHHAMNKYGYDNFAIEVIEDNIPEDQLDTKESYYIAALNSGKEHGNYNMTEGGDGGRTSSKFNGETIWELYRMLADVEAYPRVKDIADYFGMDESQVAKINKGIYWRNSQLTYPIRKTKQYRTPTETNSGKNNPRARKVLCVELGISFNTIEEANNYFGVKHSHISNCCNGNRNVALDYHWRYLTNNEVC